MRSSRIRTLGLALVAVFAMSAIAVGSASASILPVELGRCVKVTAGTGNYKDAGCTEAESAGEYVWDAGAVEKEFTSIGGKAELEGKTSKVKVICASEAGAGTYTSSTGFTTTVAFKECEQGSLKEWEERKGTKCKSTGAVAEEIKTHELKGLYGVIKTPTKLGISLEADVSGETVATFECGLTETKVTGSVISPITPVNKMELEETEKFAQTGGKQAPEAFEGGATDVLTSEIPSLHTTEQAGQEVEATVKNKEKLEVRGEA